MSASIKALRLRLSWNLIEEKAEGHVMKNKCDSFKKKPTSNTQEHWFKTVLFHPGKQKGSPGIPSEMGHASNIRCLPELQLVAHFFFTSMQINFKRWVATFSQVPKLLVFMYLLLSLVWVEKFTKLFRLLCT